MPKKTLTAQQIMDLADMELNDFTTCVEVGKINRNIAYEIQQEDDNPGVLHLFVVEYKPKTKEAILLSGHGLRNAAEDRVEHRVLQLKELYQEIAFEEGDAVQITSGQYKGINGVIEEVKRTYMELTSDGSQFEMGGLLTIEDTIPFIALNHEFDGYTLKVEFPLQERGSGVFEGETKVSSFYGYYYSVRVKTKDLSFELPTESLLIGCSHHGITKVKK